MNNRTKLLLGFMVLMVGAWVGDQFGLLGFLDSSGQGESELDKVTRQIAKAEDIIVAGAEASKALSTFESRSLPYDPAEARSAYQSWLTRLVEKNAIQRATVEVGTPTSIHIKDSNGKNKEAYKRYSFTVSGMGKLDSITNFLFSFYQAGHLHKITSMTLTPGAAGIFSVSIAGEALGVTSCERKSELTTVISSNLAHENVEDYANIVRRNIFSKEGAKTLKRIKLSSITFDKTGQPEAWFQTSPSQTSKRLQRDNELEVSVHTIKVIDIQPLVALLDVDGQILEITIGQSIDEALGIREETTPMPAAQSPDAEVTLPADE